jgi:LEA14-like dessication related protein
MRLFQLVAVVGLAACLSGCAEPKPPTIEPHAVSVTGVTPLALELEVELDVTNPNGFAIVVKSVTGELRVGKGEGKVVGEAEVDTKMKVDAKATKRVSSDLSVGWTDLAVLAPLALEAKAVPYTFDGKARVGGDKLNVAVPFTLKGELTRVQLLKVGLNSLPKIDGLPSLLP